MVKVEEKKGGKRKGTKEDLFPSLQDRFEQPSPLSFQWLEPFFFISTRIYDDEGIDL